MIRKLKFNKGDIVLKKTLPFKVDPHDKFKPSMGVLKSLVIVWGALVLAETDKLSFLSLVILIL